ncbi:MAG: helix-hairpin-helix domain-containing protein [Ferruginibacter sp.]
MDNYQIADVFSLLSKLMDIHGENSFKSKSYSSAAFAIEKSDLQLSEIPEEKIVSLKGIGASTSQKIIEILKTGHLKALDEIIFNTPPGVIEMMNIKGIGPKKINTIWKEMEIESVGELLYACQENRLKIYKGFGEKTQQTIIDTIEFYLKNRESHLYSQVVLVTEQTTVLLKKLFGEKNVFITGELKMQSEIVDDIDFLIVHSLTEIENKLNGLTGLSLEKKNDDFVVYKSSSGVKIKLIATDPANLVKDLVYTSSSLEFSNALTEQFSSINYENCSQEEAFFEKAGMAFIPAYLREDKAIIEIAKSGDMPVVIEKKDIKGIIHCHSNWSDGSNTIEELAEAAITKGLEYLVISDHSKSAFYANGLSEEKIIQQHIYIDELNERLQPFKIFKSIESDILNDGSLDYNNTILSSFDLIIASVHSNLKMTEEKAMKRLLTAIENPYTTILGHMTGRLLLSRNGYPVDHKKIIEACASNKVVIELNAHPNRLDMDWRYIRYALEKGVLISIDPDAHFIEGLEDIHYGVLVAQKGMLTKENNLSSFSRIEFQKYITEKKSTIAR